MLRSWPLLIVAFTLLATDARAVSTRPWDIAVAKRCPSRHFEWMGEGLFDEIIGGFVRTLPRSEQSRITLIADYSHRCKSEEFGFSCEMAVYSDAMRRLGLLDRFAAYGCSHYICTDIAYCDRASKTKAR